MGKFNLFELGVGPVSLTFSACLRW